MNFMPFRDGTLETVSTCSNPYETAAKQSHMDHFDPDMVILSQVTSPIWSKAL